MLDSIEIRGAREHNLKDINVQIPRDKMVVITGLSGSGKSSLAFDTIYAEGQRRYVESLSSYARQFLGQMQKPDLDSIDGLSPAVSIDQKTTSRNPRSTVGTVTEIYDYLRLLFARIGIPHCPECGRVIQQQTVDELVDAVLSESQGRRCMVLAPVVRGRKGEYAKLFQDLRKEGFSRVRVDGELIELADAGDLRLDKNFKHNIEVVVDRIVLKEESTTRLAQAIEMCTKMAEGNVFLQLLADEARGLAEEIQSCSLALACPEHGHSMDSLEPRDFSFNAPYGACPDCSGLGYAEEMNPDLIIADPKLAFTEGACKLINFHNNYYPQVLRAVAKHLGTSIDVPWKDYTPEVKKAFLEGIPEKVRVDYQTRDGRDTHWLYKWDGLKRILMDRYAETTSESQKAKLQEYLITVPCTSCKGARLRPEILAVTVGGLNINQVCELSIKESLDFFTQLRPQFSPREEQIAGRIIKEILARLQFLVNVGLDYLTLSRSAVTLSGGEAQRIRLATQIGAGLMGVLYILDEPSIGLHQRDNQRLIEALLALRDLGNTVIVVEHDEETIRSADVVLDVGPGAGAKGGYIVAQGSPQEIEANENSLTGDYLAGRRSIAVPAKRRQSDKELVIKGARENNLQNLDVTFKLGCFNVVTGVSGSGKSSLITDTLAPALTNRIHRSKKRVGEFDEILGIEYLDKVIDIDQSPIGRTPRSNPATYTGLWDDIRNLLAQTPDAKALGYAPGRFSFNVNGGRCEACKGDGEIKIEMHFLPDIYVPCEVCKGARYNRETLLVKYKGKNVSEILNMSVDEALTFFESIPSLRNKLQTLHDVGLGYISLGQPATTLSGGEAQRVKLASELQRRATGNTLYILDEPTTGLHFDDVRQLLDVLQRLVDRGNTVLVIEHNLDVIKCADWIIDLGPEGGNRGGKLLISATPEEVALEPCSYTGQFLKGILS